MAESAPNAYGFPEPFPVDIYLDRKSYRQQRRNIIVRSYHMSVPTMPPKNVLSIREVRPKTVSPRNLLKVVCANTLQVDRIRTTSDQR